MNFELALKLKEAGFPQGDGNEFYYMLPDVCMRGAILRDVYTTNGEMINYQRFVYRPTLSTLIKTCGEDLESLVLVKADGYLIKRHWRAYPTSEAYYEKLKGDCVEDCCGYETGVTPEETVANLLIKIYEKSK